MNSSTGRLSPPAQEPSGGSARKKPHFVFKAADVTVELISSIFSTIFKVFGSILLIFIITGMLFACVFAYYVKTCLTPNLDLSLDDYKLNQSSTIYYQDAGGEWRELSTLSGKQKRVWVDYGDIPWYMEKAVVAIEDKRFYDHKGVDWYRTSGAFVKMFATMQNSYGGSTITQQLIKNLTGQDQVTVQRKLTEIFGALELEKRYDKQEIIEWYLNAVYFGEGCYGVQTAAQTYFGKDVKDLSLAECAAIVGITNKPTYYDPFYNEENNKERQETILREMYEQGYIDYQMYKEAVEEPLVFTHSAEEETTQRIYSYYEEVVIADVINDLMERKGISRETAQTLVYNGGYKIYCCVDVSVQSAIDAVYTDLTAIPRASRDQQLQSAIVVMNPYDGRILGLAGGVGVKDRNFPLNRATGTYRSPGSSIKPLASYGPAVDTGLITPNTLVNDQAANFQRVCQNNGVSDGKDSNGHYITMPAGCSEHQTGLSCDITDVYREIKNSEIENTDTYKWLLEHCAEYGFIHRFPSGKEDVTGVMYEPFHFRYVGIEAARYIEDNGLCLEEFVELYSGSASEAEAEPTPSPAA